MNRSETALIAALVATMLAGIASILVAVLVKPKRGHAGTTTKLASTGKSTHAASTIKPAESALQVKIASGSFNLGSKTLGLIGTAGTGSGGSDPFVITRAKPTATGFVWDNHAAITPSKALIDRLSKLGSSFKLLPVAVGRLFARVGPGTETRILAAEVPSGKSNAAGTQVKLGNTITGTAGNSIESNTVMLLSPNDGTSFFYDSVYVFMLDASGDGGYFLSVPPAAAIGAPLIWGPRVDATYWSAMVPTGALYPALS